MGRCGYHGVSALRSKLARPGCHQRCFAAGPGQTDHGMRRYPELKRLGYVILFAFVIPEIHWCLYLSFLFRLLPPRGADRLNEML